MVANTESRGRLRIYQGARTIYDELVDLKKGRQSFGVTVEAEKAGAERFRAEIEPERDGRIENNVAEGFTIIGGPPQVLVVASESDRASALVSALEAGNRNPVLIDPLELAQTTLGLSSFESIILVDVPARDIPRPTMEALAAAVRELGRGLVMIGGEDSFGAGGYRHTPIEKALPVEMEVRDKEHRPDIAIGFVIDRSGSMGGGGGPGSPIGKLELAKEAILQAGDLVRPEDMVGVQAFDDKSHEVWPIQAFSNPSGFGNAVRGIAVGGGTNIKAGLEAATIQLEKQDVPLKHIILLSDGWSDQAGYESLLARMEAAGITLSIVAIGQGSAPFLTQLAAQGRGRFYPVEDPADIPRIFVEETLTSMGTFIIEERFQPVPGAPSQVLAGLPADALPALSGYNGTTAKQSATVGLWSHLEDPVLAHWQYGLGRSVAWTSDLKNQWASDWTNWGGFADFVLQLVDWSVPEPDDTGLDLDAELDGGHLSLRLNARSDSGSARDFLNVEARISGPEAESFSVDLVQSESGVYTAETELPVEGAYLARIIAKDSKGQNVGARTTGFIVPYSPEYADPSDQPTDPRLFKIAEMSGGRVLEIDAPEKAFDAVSGITTASEIWHWLIFLSIVLLPLDIGVRRLRIRPQEFWIWLLRRRNPLGEKTEAEQAAGMGSLFQAKERARRGVRSRREADTRAGTAQGATPDAVEPRQAREQDESQKPRPGSHSASARSGAQQPAGQSETSGERPKEAPPAEDDSLSRLRKAKKRARRRR